MITGSVVLGDTTGLSGTDPGTSDAPDPDVSDVSDVSDDPDPDDPVVPVGSGSTVPPSFSRILILRTYTVVAFPSSRVTII